MPSFASQYPGRFVQAFIVLIEDFAERNYFTEAAPSECSDGIPIGVDNAKLRRTFLLSGVDADWPLLEGAVEEIEVAQVVELIEAFFNIVSAPESSQFHSFCQGWHPESYDRRKGRYDYTVAVNDLLARYKIPWRLSSGRVKADGSRVLSPALAEELPTHGDEHLQNLLNSAVDNFRLGSELERVQALGHLADALERVKSQLNPSNKKASVDELIRVTSTDSRIRPFLNELLRVHTDISNSCHIRHFEHDKIELNHQPLFVDYLFYSYYNLIRFLLNGLANSSSDRQG